MFQITQVVDIGNTLSQEKPLFSGVPQGSILTPLLFVMFFNDVEEHLQHARIIQYADDTVILFAHEDVDTISKLLNEDLNNVSTYCYENELLVNLKTSAFWYCAPPLDGKE